MIKRYIEILKGGRNASNSPVVVFMVPTVGVWVVTAFGFFVLVGGVVKVGTSSW